MKGCTVMPEGIMMFWLKFCYVANYPFNQTGFFAYACFGSF